VILSSGPRRLQQEPLALKLWIFRRVIPASSTQQAAALGNEQVEERERPGPEPSTRVQQTRMDGFTFFWEMARMRPGAFEPYPGFQPTGEIPQHVLEKGSTSSRGRVIKKSSKVEDAGFEGVFEDGRPPSVPTPRGRWDGAISPRTPGVAPTESFPPVQLPKVPGGGGIFKSAAVAVLREENRLMPTGEIARLALARGYVRCQGKTPEATMASALYTDVKKKGDKSIFTRPEEGLFGLREWVAPGEVFETKPPASKAVNRIPSGSKRPLPKAEPKPRPAPKPATSSHSVDENLLLLLNAADELEAEGQESKPRDRWPQAKRRRSETGDYRPRSKYPTGRSVPIARPKPLQLPLSFAMPETGAALAAAAKLPTPTPPTPGAEEPNTVSPMSPSHDSQGSSRHNPAAQASRRAGAAMDVEESSPAKPMSAAKEYYYSTETSTSSDDSSMEDEGAGYTSNAAGANPAQARGMPQFPQVGQMLAAGHFAARLIQANQLISNLDTLFGPKHPLVGKAYIAKARICQMEGSRLSLMEAEQAIMQARNILNSTSDAQGEIMYLLDNIRQQAYMLSKTNSFAGMAGRATF